MKKTSALLIIMAFIPMPFIACKTAPQTPPNFIFILADDLGWTSHSYLMDNRYAGSRSEYYETPNMDRLAEEGIRFTNGYAPASICTPSRRSIQFGQMPVRLGDLSFKEKYQQEKSRWLTIPRMLKSIDPAYKTAHYGKWDLRADITPEELGYDESDGNTGNKDGDVMTDKTTKWTKVHINDDPKRTVSLTSRALGFMTRQADAGNPFYMQVSFYATHVDIQTTEKAYDKYSRKEKGAIHDNPGFAGMLEDLDTGVGRIMEKLKELGIENNTYIIFMTDNGGVDFIPPPPIKNKLDPPSSFPRKMSNYPLRGGKWVLYEGGIRVPFIVKGPGIQPGGYRYQPVTGYDLLPTLSDLAGNKNPLPESLDGGSFRPLFNEKAKGLVKRKQDALYFHRYNNSYKHSAIIDGQYKLIRFWKTDKVELYDLDKDPGEIHDLSAGMHRKAKELEGKLMTYLEKEHSEALYPPAQPASGNKKQTRDD